MKNVIDAIVEDIKKSAIDDINERMQKLIKDIVTDLTNETIRLIDKYYDTYAPIKYIRLHPPRTLRSGENPKGKSRSKGPSLYKAITRNNGEALSFSSEQGWIDGKYVYQAGIEFDENDFKGSLMYHKGKGISEWDILENFLYAGEGKGSGDARSYPVVSHQSYEYDSADVELLAYIANYDTIFDKHFKKHFPKIK